MISTKLKICDRYCAAMDHLTIGKIRTVLRLDKKKELKKIQVECVGYERIKRKALINCMISYEYQLKFSLKYVWSFYKCWI